MFELRPYQTEIVNEAQLRMKQGSKSVLITAPTGSGKTVLMAHMLRTAAQRGKRSWMIVHRKELLDQTCATLREMSVPFGVVAAKCSRGGGLTDHAVQICSVQTLTRRLGKLPPPSLIVFDECHHVAAASWKRIYETHTSAYKIGLTATPMRLDGQGLKSWFDSMVLGPDVASLTQQGYLSPYRLFAPSTVSLSGVKTRMGDWIRGELAPVMNKASITGSVIDTYKRVCPGRRAIVFCVSVAHSKAVAQQFNDAGIKAIHIDGETRDDERREGIKAFRGGGVTVLCGCDLFGEGLDIPGIECAILLRPTQSLGLYMQQVGRALRVDAGKHGAIILDHVGNASRHGLPDDPREWSLDGVRGKKKSADAGFSVRICKVCFGAAPRGSKVCEYCGTEFEMDARDIAEKEGELVEINLENERKLRGAFHSVKNKSFEDYVIEGKRRGYKHPYGWAKFYKKSVDRRIAWRKSR